MARLPDVPSMGARPLPEPSGPVPGANTTVQNQAQINMGEQIAGMGQSFYEAGQRIQGRRDAIERARAYSSYEEEGEKELMRFSTEDDFSLPSSMAKYGNFLKEKQQEIVKGHVGSEESRLMLTERLENSRSNLVFKAAALSHKAQKDLAVSTSGKVLTKSSTEAYDNPASLPDLFQKWDRHVDDIKDAYTPEEEMSVRDGGRAQMAQSALDSLIVQGQFDKAEEIMDMPFVQDVLGPDGGRKIKNNILSAKLAMRNETMKALGESNAKLAAARQMLGRDLRPDERYALVFGQSKSDKPVFGESITGRSLSILTEGSEAYKYGLMTPAQERIYEAAAVQYTQPAAYQNPDTGVMEMRRPVMPPQVSEALQMRGKSLPAPDLAEPGDDSQPAQSSQPSGKPEATAPETATEAPKSQRTAWDMAGDVTGPIPAAREAVGRVPVLGEMLPSSEVTQARTYIPLLQRDLVRTLQNNPRYAEGERKAIEADIKIEPRLIDNKKAYRNRLLAIDQALEVRQDNAFKTSQSKKVGREERVQAMNVLNAINNFRVSLGVPPSVKSDEEYKAIPSGTKFVDPEGNTRTKP